MTNKWSHTFVGLKPVSNKGNNYTKIICQHTINAAT